MAEEELNLDSELDQVAVNAENKLKVKNRFEKLSEKVILSSKEKEQEADARKKAETERDSLAKERDFYKDFSTHASKYPNVSEYQDKILEKVNKGYSTEDAMVSVLASEGKLTPQATKVPTIAGGSAPTNQTGTKSIQDMTADEKLSALTEADQAGDLANALRGR